MPHPDSPTMPTTSPASTCIDTDEQLPTRPGTSGTKRTGLVYQVDVPLVVSFLIFWIQGIAETITEEHEPQHGNTERHSREKELERIGPHAIDAF